MESLFAAPLLKTARDRPRLSRRARRRRQRRRAAARRRRRRRRPDRRRRRRASTSQRRADVDADGLALMPGIIDSHTHFDAQITWDPTLSPSPALGVTTAVIGNCGFTIAPCRPADRELDDAQPDAGRGHVDRRAARRHRLGLRDLRRVPGAVARARQRRQRRRLRRPFVGAHLRDGRRRGAARGDAPTRSRRCRRSCATRWRTAPSASPAAPARRTTARAACRCRRGWRATTRWRRWSARWAKAAAASTC